jgi:hypothetical protein
MLRRIKVATMSPPRPAQSTVVDASFASQCLGEFLARVRKIDPHPAVLDLGVLCGANIAFLGLKGCRVSVESLPRAKAAAPPALVKHDKQDKQDKLDKKSGEGAVAAPPTPLPPLSYPPGSFSGVLAWDAISRMPSAEATAFVETLRKLLLSGGAILAYFPGPPGGGLGPAGRYRIMSEDRLAVEASTERSLPQTAYQNREIYALFSRFEVVRLSHLKSGTREVLVAKSRRA